MERQIIISESNDYGDKTKAIKSFYNVNTDKQEYLIFILEYKIDTENLDKVMKKLS
jgi:hypothetical protein